MEFYGPLPGIGQLGPDHSPLGLGIGQLGPDPSPPGPGTRTLSTRTGDRTWDQIILH